MALRKVFLITRTETTFDQLREGDLFTLGGDPIPRHSRYDPVYYEDGTHIYRATSNPKVNEEDFGLTTIKYTPALIVDEEEQVKQATSPQLLEKEPDDPTLLTKEDLRILGKEDSVSLDAAERGIW